MRDVNPPILAGILPVILFVFNSRFTNFVNNPKVEGRLPPRLFEVICKNVRLVNDPRDEGMVPVRLWDCMTIFVTAPFTASHVTPVQGDGLLLHTPGDATPFTHFQLDVAVDDMAAATSHITVSEIDPPESNVGDAEGILDGVDIGIDVGEAGHMDTLPAFNPVPNLLKQLA